MTEYKCDAVEVESIAILEARAKEYMAFYEIIEKLSKIAIDRRVQEELRMTAMDLLDYSQRVKDQIGFKTGNL